jgi:hypothetical protein
MNSGEISLEHCVAQLREMFPNLDEEIILSALYENGNNFEATLNCLINFQCDTNFVDQSPQMNQREEQEKEISIFGNIVPKEQVRQEGREDFFLDRKQIEAMKSGVSTYTGKTEYNPSSTYMRKDDTSINKDLNKNKRGSVDYTSKSNDKNGVNSIGISDETFSNSTQPLSNKKSFGQKFKSKIIFFKLNF